MSRRVLTLADEDGRIEAQAFVEREDGVPPRIVEVMLRSTDGHGLRTEDLLALEDMGLRSSVPERAAAEQPKVEAPKPAVKKATKKATKKAPVKAPTAKKAAAAGKAAESTRNWRPSPPVEELDQLYRQCNGSQAAMGRERGVPRHTIQSWMRRHERNSHVFSLEPATGNEGKG